MNVQFFIEYIYIYICMYVFMYKINSDLFREFTGVNQIGVTLIEFPHYMQE